MKKKSQSKRGARKKAKKPAIRDLQSLERTSRRVVGGARAGRLGKRL